MKTASEFLKRLWPQRLLGQTVLLVVLALFAAQIVGALIVRGDASAFFRGAEERFISNRLSPVTALLSETPAPLHERTVSAFSSPRFRVWLSDRPVVAERSFHRGHDDDDDRAEELRERLQADLGNVLIGQARVQVQDDDDHHNQMIGHGSGPPQIRDQLRIRTLISLPIGPDRWLNAAVAEFRERTLLRRESWAAIIVASLVVSLILALALRRITRPLTRLADAAERLGRGEDVAPLPEQGPADIRDATHAFNAMQDRLHRFVKARTQMLAAISHDLRTPITSLRLRAEMLDDAEAREKMIATLKEMQRMTEATLAFARGEASDEPTRVTDLGALLNAIGDDLSDIGMQVRVSAERFDYPCRATALSRALRNLIENAATYGKCANVGLSQEKRHVFIVVEDDGPGIPEDKLEHVFEPFVRLEASRNTDTGGIGLGMAIARDIVRRHGGDIVLENRAEGGLRAKVTLPAVN